MFYFQIKSIVIGSFHPKIGLLLRSLSYPKIKFYFTLKDLLILKLMLINRSTIILPMRCVIRSNFQFN